MKKKNSYMSKKNIMKEGWVKSLLSGFFGGERPSKKLNKYTRDVEKTLKKYNDATSSLEKAIKKEYGKDITFEKETLDDLINKAK